MKKYKKYIKILLAISVLAIFMSVFCLSVSAAGDVSGAIEKTWVDASAQIKTVVNNVVFPIIDVILGVFFFIKLALSYFDFKKHGAFEWQSPAILFACLVLALTAPLYVWGIVGL